MLVKLTFQSWKEIGDDSQETDHEIGSKPDSDFDKSDFKIFFKI